jgi:hypothetical protein
MEAKRWREGGRGKAKGRPRGDQEEAKGGQGETRRGQGRLGQARGPNQAKPSRGNRVLGAQKGTKIERKMMPKSSQNQENDFLKMSVSPRRRAHFEREGLAKPGQRGLAQTGEAKKASQGQTGEHRFLHLAAGGVHPPLKDGSPRGPWTVGLRVARLPFGAPEPFQERSKNPLFF